MSHDFSPQAQAIWSGLEFRKPMLLRNVEPLSEPQMRWRPGAGPNPIAWQLWHIGEVEDNWIRTLVTGEPLHLPFGVQVREATEKDYSYSERSVAASGRTLALVRPRRNESGGPERGPTVIP